MNDQPDELSGLKKLLEAFDGGKLVISFGGKDVTKRETAILRCEIEYLETVIRRTQSLRAAV